VLSRGAGGGVASGACRRRNSPVASRLATSGYPPPPGRPLDERSKRCPTGAASRTTRSPARVTGRGPGERAPLRSEHRRVGHVRDPPPGQDVQAPGRPVPAVPDAGPGPADRDPARPLRDRRVRQPVPEPVHRPATARRPWHAAGAGRGGVRPVRGRGLQRRPPHHSRRGGAGPHSAAGRRVGGQVGGARRGPPGLVRPALREQGRGHRRHALPSARTGLCVLRRSAAAAARAARRSGVPRAYRALC